MESEEPLILVSLATVTHLFYKNLRGDAGIHQARLNKLCEIDYDKNQELLQRRVKIESLDGISYTLGIVSIQFKPPDAESVLERVEVSVMLTYGPGTAQGLLAEAIADLQLVGIGVSFNEYATFFDEVEQAYEKRLKLFSKMPRPSQR